MRMHTITHTQNTPKPSPTHNYTYIHSYIHAHIHPSFRPSTRQPPPVHITTTFQKKGRKREKIKGNIGIREKAHKQDTLQTQQPHSTIVTSAPTSPFQHKSHSTTTSHIQNKICVFLSLPLHSHPKQKSNHSYFNKISKYSTIIWFCMHTLIWSLCTSLYSHTLHLKTESYPTL